MDQQASSRWLETLKSEARAKQRWNEKYLTDEQLAQEREEDEQAAKQLSNRAQSAPGGRRLNERQAMELRLAAFDDENFAPPPSAEKRLPDYEVLRQRVAEEVARTRARSHRFTGDLSTGSMLKDIGPALWISVNPNYAPTKLASTMHKSHIFDRTKGWGEKVDKTHHLKLEGFMKHADKCLQLGEKPFLSGGMKIKPTL